MIARAIVEELRSYNSDWSDAALLSAIDYVYQMMMGTNTDYTRAFDPATGGDPTITPTAIEHTIVDAMSITGVFAGGIRRNDLIATSDTIIFKDTDVGNEFTVQYYKAPAEISGVNVEIGIPNHLKHYLEEGSLKRMNTKTHGDTGDFIQWQTAVKGGLREFKRKLGHIKNANRIPNEQTQLYTPYA